MRDLQECQAEVFRRSEKRIKERKQCRRHMLMACIPLVLCITIFSAFILPAMIPADSSDKFAPETANAQYTGGLTNDGENSFFDSILQIDVTWGRESISYTEQGQIQLISNKIYGLSFSYGSVTPEDSSSPNGGSLHSDNPSDGEIPDSTSISCTITFVMDKGNSVEYCLVGNKLLNRSADHEVSLSQEQVKELCDALGIPQQ